MDKRILSSDVIQDEVINFQEPWHYCASEDTTHAELASPGY